MVITLHKLVSFFWGVQKVDMKWGFIWFAIAVISAVDGAVYIPEAGGSATLSEKYRKYRRGLNNKNIWSGQIHQASNHAELSSNVVILVAAFIRKNTEILTESVLQAAQVGCGIAQDVWCLSHPVVTYGCSPLPGTLSQYYLCDTVPSQCPTVTLSDMWHTQRDLKTGLWKIFSYITQSFSLSKVNDSVPAKLCQTCLPIL